MECALVVVGYGRQQCGLETSLVQQVKIFGHDLSTAPGIADPKYDNTNTNSRPDLSHSGVMMFRSVIELMNFMTGSLGTYAAPIVVGSVFSLLAPNDAALPSYGEAIVLSFRDMDRSVLIVVLWSIRGL